MWVIEEESPVVWPDRVFHLHCGSNTLQGWLQRGHFVEAQPCFPESGKHVSEVLGEEAPPRPHLAFHAHSVSTCK